MFVERNKGRQLGSHALGHAIANRVSRLAKRKTKAKQDDAMN